MLMSQNAGGFSQKFGSGAEGVVDVVGGCEACDEGWEGLAAVDCPAASFLFFWFLKGFVFRCGTAGPANVKTSGAIDSPSILYDIARPVSEWWR